MKKTLASLGFLLAFPVVAFAQEVGSVQDLALWIIGFINNIAVPFVFAIAFIVFVFGVFQMFILGRGDEEKAAAGRSLVIWGLVGFFVMLCVWGLVHIATGTFDLNNNAPDYPTTPYTP